MSGNTNTDILLAGAVAAFTVDLLVYPLDTIKTRLQSPNYKTLFTNSTNGTVDRALFRGVYQGIGSVILATLPSSGAFFTTYEGAKSIYTTTLTRSGTQTTLLPLPLIHALASATAELISCAILTPAEVIKQNAQMVQKQPSQTHNTTSKPPSTNATLSTLRRFQHNPLALWRGYAALAGRNLPFTALQFPLFERLKERGKAYRDERGTRTGSVLETGVITALSAGSAGSVAAVLTTPVDVVKTRIMLGAVDDASAATARSAGTEGSGNGNGNGNGNSGGNKRTQGRSNGTTTGNTSGLVDALGQNIKRGATSAKQIASTGSKTRKSSLAIAKEIVRDQGFKGLWRGGALRAVWTMLGSGLYLGVYESGRIYLANRRAEG
ncbi:mitochondrial carrier [Pseudovirgaria hyperparasitica]|uniref:Mitochondrial carrier n=1 Tax=Pseudovirgaria hyperparasitica TaxID=470096 RepID=A0A6A6WH95_9PEZI|nr:mitochondrial carrier [Pseudovirgaria hyperparasitica]KAF2761589.1 mitochondrial carrier [Pseudovirgaria hyperparasitica]